jgi:putative Ca2+/H+ antiporter (TMEM165/GDT1 family)
MTGAHSFLHVPVSVFAVAYATVFLAELVGDKSVYTIAALAMRFRTWPVFGGAALAFAGKMLVAVVFGKALIKIPGHWTSILSAVGFFACAVFIWLREPARNLAAATEARGWLYAAAISFSSLFLTEWCDTGQIAAGAMAAHTRELLWVWLGGTLALWTKTALAITVGAKLTTTVPGGLIRVVASVAYLTLGILSLSQAFVS